MSWRQISKIDGLFPFLFPKDGNNWNRKETSVLNQNEMKIKHLISILLWSRLIESTSCFQPTNIKTVASVAETSTCHHTRLTHEPHSKLLSRSRRSELSLLNDNNWEEIFKNTDVWVFLIGLFPFAWASVEFWRRIAFGEAFGTGSDQVIIGFDEQPEDSRGRRVLGKGALLVAYFLFAASFATISVVIYSVVSSNPAPEILPSQQLLEGQINE